MSKIYFPLKSNVEWFQNNDLKASILERLKYAFLLYDEIVIENGTYMAEVTKHSSFSPYLPEGHLPVEERYIQYDKDIKPTKLQLGMQSNKSDKIHTIINDTTIARYKIDYYEFMSELNLEENNFIEYVHIAYDKFPKESKEALRNQISRDKALFKDEHKNDQLRNMFIKNLNEDIITSMLLNATVIFDYRHANILAKKCLQNSNNVFKPAYNEVAFKQIISFVVEDLSNLSLTEVVNLREDPLWKEFRSFIDGIVKDVINEPHFLMNHNETVDKIQSRINKEIMSQLTKRIKKPKKLCVDIGLGLTSMIPVYGAIPTAVSVGDSIRQFYSDKSSWIAFLLKLKE